MRKFLLIILAGFIIQHSFAQNFSNAGKEFYLCFPNHVHNSNNNQATLSIFITSDQASSGTITMANGFFSATFNLTAANGFFQEVQIAPPNATTASPAQIFSTESNTVGQKSIKVAVNAGQPAVVVYAQQWAGARTAATLVLPSAVLGKRYIATSYTQNGSSNGTAHQAKSQFQVIAVKPNTSVQVTPRFNGVAQPSFNISLPNVGDIYQYQPTSLTVDITGTYIESIASGTAACSPIAVFSGSSNLTVGGGACNGNSYDPLWQQMYPINSWGKNYGFIPFALYNNGNFYRVIASEANTQVFVNGVLATTLANIGDIYPSTFTSNPTLTTAPSLITADKPIGVAHYSQAQACAGGQTNLGDPDMVMLNSIEQNISDITVFSSNTQAITNKYINILIPTNGIANFKISRNGGPLLAPLATWQPFTPLAGYSYIKENIANTITRVRLKADSGFNAIAYGFGAAESYSYSAGTNVRDFNQQLFTPSQYGILNDGISYACLNTPFNFNVYLPETAISNSGPTAGTSVPVRYDSLRWTVTSATNFVPNNFPVMVRPLEQLPIPGAPYPPFYPNPVVREDSIRIRNGKSVAFYSLPTPYAITAPGTYTITVRGYRTNANGDGCTSGNETDFDFTLVVPGAPVASFTNTTPGCPADSVYFTETNVQSPPSSSTYIFNWNFGDLPSGANNTSNVRNPVHRFSAPGSYTVTFSNITAAGCVSATTSQQVVVPDLVNATIAGTAALCQNATQPSITFTGTNGAIPYTFTYNINGGASQTISTTGTNTSVTLLAPTTTAGTFAYNLTKVENANPLYCSRVITGQTSTVTVNPLPTATITGTVNVCQNTTAPLITFTGANATAPYTFTYNINGGTSQTITTTTGNSVTIAAPTTTVGTYIYNLVSVVDATTTLCTSTATGTATVVVQATPSATIAGTVSLCQDATAPNITFNGINGNAPFTFTYNINGGATQTITSSASSNSVTVPVSMATTGTFVYNLLSVQNTGPTTCITNITGASATVVINPVPTATITGTTTVCQVVGAQTVTLTGAGGTAPYTFTYSINGITQPTVVSTGNIATLTAPVTTVGTFVYNIISIQDASSTLCIRNYPLATQPSATVIVQATSTATISGTTTICQNAAAPNITFTAANGVAPFTFTYNINGGATQSVSTLATANSVTVPVSMAASGTFVYNLLSVKNTGTINCTTPITGASATVIINPVPTATIAGTTTVCQNTTAPAVTFTGANGTAPYTFNYTLNTVPQTITTLSGNSITLNAPTGIPGVYNYVLTSVKDASSTLCTQTQSGTATITVKQIATATISTSAATVCQANTVAPFITFTATGGVAPFTFTYKINGGANLTVTTTVGSSVNVPVSTATPGTFIYTLVSVQESSSAACVNPQTGSAQVIVHPKPTASYTTVGPYCALKSVTFTPIFNITPTGSITSWVWDYGDGTGPHIRTDGLPFTLTYPTAGVKTVSFKTISDNGCVSDLYSTAVTINSKPKAGFKNPEACLADTYAQFTDTSTVVGGSIVFWEWDFGDATPILAGSGPTFQNPLHAFLTVGQKTVKLIVTTNSGCKDTIIQQFFINGEVTKANFTTLNAANLCSNRPVQIKESSVVNVGGLIRVDIYWDYVGSPTVFELDDFPTPNKIYTHNYPNLQTDVTYKVRYFAYSGFNGVCQKDTIIDVLVHASPIATFAPVQDVCLNGGPVVLNQGTASGGTAVYMGPGVTFAGGVYTFNPLAIGVVIGTSNNVTYTVTSTAGCDSALVRQVKVLAPPVVNTFAPVGNICHNNAVTFHQTYTNGDGTVVKWIYNWGDGTPNTVMTTGADVTHVYTTTGTQTATLTLETGYGCRNIPFPVTFTVNALPVPNYTFTSTACLPSASITFTNNTPPNLANYSYQWSFVLPSTLPGDVSTATSPTHVYTTLGPHNTHLIATNLTTGCKDSTVVIPVNSIHPAPVLQFTTVPDVCLNNGTVQLTQGSETSGIAGGPGIYSGAGVSASGVFNPITAGVGTHTITYTWTSTFNCPTSITQTVKVLAEPVVNTFTTIGNVCEQNGTVFQNTVTQGAGNIITWVYDWGDGTTNSYNNAGADVTHTYALAGLNYHATLYVITDYGCKSKVKDLFVNVNPIPRPNFRYSDTTCLPQAKVLFTNTTPNINDWAYQWNFDFPSTLVTDQSTQQQNLQYTYTTLTPPHTVRLIAQSGLTGCKDSIFKVITTIHPAPVAKFDFSKPSVCIGSSVSVIDQSTFADGTSNKWEWNWGDATTSISPSPAPHTYATDNTYDVTLKVTNSFGCIDDTLRKFTVHPFPVVNAGRDSIILQGGNLMLTPTVTGNDLTYVWSGTPAPINLNDIHALNPIASPVEDITYGLTVTGRGGCTAPTDYVFIKVLKFPVIPNTFTPNNDGVHDTWVIKYLESYPDNRVQVFTRTGQLIFESRRYLKPWDGTVNGKPLPFDTYYYIIEPGSGRIPLTGYVTIVK